MDNKQTLFNKKFQQHSEFSWDFIYVLPNVQNYQKDC